MRHLFAFALKLAISVLLLYLALVRVDLSVVAQRLTQIEIIWLAAALFILGGMVVMGALRWQKIVLHCDMPNTLTFPIARALRYVLVATFFNQTLPSTVGGDAVRIWVLGRDGTGWRTATYSVLIDRFSGIFMLALIVLVCLPWSFVLVDNFAGRITLLVVGFGSLGACLAILAMGFVRWRWPDRWWLTRHLISAALVARQILTSRSTGAQIAIYSLLIQLMMVSAVWCLAKSAAIPLAWAQALLLVLPVLLIATIPLSIAGWGVRESAMIMAFTYAGLAQSDGLIVSVLLGAAMFAVGLVGGSLWILGGGNSQFGPRAGAEKGRQAQSPS